MTNSNDKEQHKTPEADRPTQPAPPAAPESPPQTPAESTTSTASDSDAHTHEDTSPPVSTVSETATHPHDVTDEQEQADKAVNEEEHPVHHAMAAAASPAEILTVELLKREQLIPSPAPQSGDKQTSDNSATTQGNTPAASESDTPAQTPAPADESDITQFDLAPPVSTDQENRPSETEPEGVEVAPEFTPEPSLENDALGGATHILQNDTPPSTEKALIKTRKPVRHSRARVWFRYSKRIIMHPSILMVMSAFLFSSMILFVKLASVYYSNFEIIASRGIIGAVCILLFQQIKMGPIKGALSLKTKYLGMQAWRAFIGTMSMSCWFYGVSKLSLALSTTLSYMSSVWIAIFIISSAFITGRSRPSLKLVFSILLGFAGILVILRPSGTDVDMFAAAVVVISSVFGALAYLQVAALGRIGEPAYRTVFYFCLFGVFFGLAAALFTQGRLSDFNLAGFAWLILIGILAMLAQFCLTLAYTGGNALVNASLQYSGLIFVIIFDWILGIGWPDYFTWLGMALVVISGLMATLIRAKHK